MKNSFRLASLTLAIAAIPSISLAQVAQTVIVDGLGTTATYDADGQAVLPVGLGSPPSITSTVAAPGASTTTTQTATSFVTTTRNLALDGNSGVQAQQDSVSIGNYGLTQRNGVRATFVTGGTNLTEVGSFTGAGVLASGFSNNGAAGTNAIVGDTTVNGGLTVTGTTSTNGINNNGQVISNVASGVAASDVSTVGQLNAATAAQAVTNANQQNFNSQIQAQTDGNRRVASTGTAIVAAAASIPALEAGKKMGLGLGVGGYDGRSAVSVALAARASESLQFKFHVGTGSGGKVAAGAGGIFSW